MEKATNYSKSDKQKEQLRKNAGKKEKSLKKKAVSIRKAKKGKKEINRQEHKIDLTGLVFGRAAVQVALLLSGKRKVEYLPYLDTGDKVTVYNLEKLKFKGGRKLEDKTFYHYSGYPGGIKAMSLRESVERDFPKVFRRAVYQMLPKNKLRKGMIKRLRIFKGEIEERTKNF